MAEKAEHNLAVDNGKNCITEKQYLEFLEKIRTDPNWFHLRMGQAFCNYFKLTDAELYYCVDEAHTIILIMKYIKDWR